MRKSMENLYLAVIENSNSVTAARNKFILQVISSYKYLYNTIIKLYDENKIESEYSNLYIHFTKKDCSYCITDMIISSYNIRLVTTPGKEIVLKEDMYKEDITMSLEMCKEVLTYKNILKRIIIEHLL